MFENPSGGAHRLAMNGHRIIDLPGVTAGHGYRYRDVAFAAGAENVLVARGETGESQRQPTEPVIVIRIGTGQINHQLRVSASENFLERRRQLLQIEGVAAAVRQELVEGYPDGTFRPDGEVTRAEAAAVIARLLEQI